MGRISVYPPRVEAASRFASKVDSAGGADACWPWTAGRCGGYGAVKGSHYREKVAHRLAYRLVVGDIPAGFVVRHKCDNRLCCNPRHLEIGTHVDNVADRVKRGRSACREQNGRAKLAAREVWAIRAAGSSVKPSVLAAHFRVVDPATVRAILTGKTWKTLPHDSPTASDSPPAKPPMNAGETL